MHHGRAQSGSQADRGRVEGMVVDDVVAAIPRRVVDASESLRGDRRAADGAARWSVKGGRQGVVIDSRVDHLDAPYC